MYNKYINQKKKYLSLSFSFMAPRLPNETLEGLRAQYFIQDEFLVHTQNSFDNF
jgi:hypothetical protein